MKKRNRKVLAGILALGLGAAGAAAIAQPYWHGGPGPAYMGGGPCWGYDGGTSASSWQDIARKRTADLHDMLKLNATQENAWKNYQATITANIKAMQEREMMDFSSMTAPERLEKSQQLMKERDDRMARHLEALKGFYSTLSAEQQQIFDAEAGPGPGYGWHRGGRWHRDGNWHHGGGPGPRY